MAQGSIVTNAQLQGVVEPILNVVSENYKTRPTQYDKVFKIVKGVERAYHEEVYMTGLPVSSLKPSGGPTQYTSFSTQYLTRLVYQAYSLAVPISRESLDDGEHVDLAMRYSTELMISAMERREIEGANILNFAFNSSFTANPGDGQPLVSTAHPLAVASPLGGSTLSNRVAGDPVLSQTAVEQAVTQIYSFTDNTGRFIQLNPKKLIVPTALSLQAPVILQSYLRTGTNNNDQNPLNPLFSDGYVVMQRLTSPSAWFIQTDSMDKNPNNHGLFMAKRTEIELTMEPSFTSEALRIKNYDRFAFNWTEWRDIIGSAGF